jgi:hypothetical protein
MQPQRVVRCTGFFLLDAPMNAFAALCERRGPQRGVYAKWLNLTCNLSKSNVPSPRAAAIPR